MSTDRARAPQRFDPLGSPWLYRLAWLSLVLVALSLAEPSTPAREVLPVSVATAHLSIEVHDAEGRDVPGAELRLHDFHDPFYVELLRSRADARGRADATVEAGRAWLVVEKAGFARQAVPVNLGPQERASVAVTLSRGRSFRVEVRVEGDGGALVGLPDATVLVGAAGSLPWGGASDGAGQVVFSDVPSGPLPVRVFARGYEPYAAESEGDLLVRLRPVMALRVHVVDEGRPQPRARVHLSGMSLWPSRVVETGADGYVDVQGLSAGRYALYAEKADRVSPASSEVELLAERGQREITLQLAAGHFVDARVVDDRNAPITGAQLSYSRDGLGERAQRVVTDDQGQARVGPLADLAGYLQASAAGFVERLVPIEGSPLVLVLERAGVVRGRVVDEHGFPVAGAELDVVGTDTHGMPVFVRGASERIRSEHFEWSVQVEQRLVPAGELGVLLGPVPPIPLAGGARRLGSSAAGSSALGSSALGSAATSDDKGRFRVIGVPPGQLVVLGRHPDRLDGRSKPFVLSPGGEAEVEVVLGSGEAIRGRVVDDRGFPAAAAHVTLTARGFERQLEAGEDGSFALGAAPLDVAVRVTLAERPLRTVLFERFAARDPSVELRLVLPAPRAASRIVVLNARDEPVALCQVRLMSRDPHSPFEETRFTNDEGQVEFADSRGLASHIALEAPGYVALSRDVRLQADQKVQLLQALTATGRVTTARGRLPAAGASITLSWGGAERRAVANAAGEYRLSAVPPGSATLRARHAEHGRAELEVQVRAGVAGRDASLPDLDLTPGVEISGRVLDARGFPVVGAWVSSRPASVYVSRAVGYEDAVQTDAHGEYTLEIDARAELELYAAWPAHAGAYARFAREGRDRIVDRVMTLDEIDAAPPSELGTVLVSLLEEHGHLEISAVAPSGLGGRTELRVGDLLLEVDGERPKDVADARELLSGDVGSNTTVIIERSGQRRELRLSREAFMR